jgi:hypothetical protein
MVRFPSTLVAIAAVAFHFFAVTPASAADLQSVRDYFLGKTWKSPDGAAFTFLPGSQCVKISAGKSENFHWMDAGGGVIEARSADPRQTTYFRFVSATEAYYGSERNDITKPVTLGTPVSTPKPLGQGAATPSMKDFYLDKTWQSPTGTMFKFLPGGKCVKTFNLKEGVAKWRSIGSGVVEVIGNSAQDVQYFRFVSATEAYYGGKKNDIHTPVTAK